MPARPTGPLKFGAHTSAAGGVHEAPIRAASIGANAFALFLTNQRQWARSTLSEEVITQFRARCAEQKYPSSLMVPHGSYLVNLAHTDPVRAEQAYAAHLDDLKRCAALGIGLYNFHPGSNQCGDRAKAVAQLAAQINRAHDATPGSTVVTLLENMAGHGNTLGGTFEELREMIDLVKDKSRIGVCLDTCHTFAAGYDLRSPTSYKQTMELFDSIIGMKFLRALHVNDSKAPLGSKRDLHANIGTGFLGLRAFHSLVNDQRMEGIPLILETPIEVTDENGVKQTNEKGKPVEDKNIWKEEIVMLDSLRGMDVESEHFKEMETKLERKGEAERKRIMGQVDKKGKPKKTKGKAVESNSDSESG
ncbi:AP endonuclease [Piedraia hortae CBS 480.64]|uniref:Apurinic-apyrimidinic endonuclease 1 n=1 Tax=Piedraia hortae CBS 480.64 TaxID=1314780 RepID=A0A6A7BRT2_9PEZI|nr:AP endonuclease [Piedraia hortae CBS 480.64]